MTDPAAGSNGGLSPELQEALLNIYLALRDHEKLIRIAGATSTYTPPEKAPLVRLAKLLGVTEDMFRGTAHE